MRAMSARPRRTARLLLIVVLAAWSAACSAAGASPSAPSGPASVLPERPSASVPDLRTVEPSLPPITGEVPPAMLAAVLATITEATGQDASGATIVEAVAVEWSDGSLGCPEAGMLYPQVITPGYQVVVELDGQRYDARVAKDGAVIRLCEGLGPAGG
jgi:hypothetical protein